MKKRLIRRLRKAWRRFWRPPETRRSPEPEHRMLTHDRIRIAGGEITRINEQGLEYVGE